MAYVLSFEGLYEGKDPRKGNLGNWSSIQLGTRNGSGC